MADRQAQEWLDLFLPDLLHTPVPSIRLLRNPNICHLRREYLFDMMSILKYELMFLYLSRTFFLGITSQRGTVASMRDYAGQTVEIIYVDRHGRFTQRVLSVRSVRDGWVYAFCHARGEPRRFRADRILAVRPVSHPEAFRPKAGAAAPRASGIPVPVPGPLSSGGAALRKAPGSPAQGKAAGVPVQRNASGFPVKGKACSGVRAQAAVSAAPPGTAG